MTRDECLGRLVDLRLAAAARSRYHHIRAGRWRAADLWLRIVMSIVATATLLSAIGSIASRGVWVDVVAVVMAAASLGMAIALNTVAARRGEALHGDLARRWSELAGHADALAARLAISQDEPLESDSTLAYLGLVMRRGWLDSLGPLVCGKLLKQCKAAERPAAP